MKKLVKIGHAFPEIASGETKCMEREERGNQGITCRKMLPSLTRRCSTIPARVVHGLG